MGALLLIAYEPMSVAAQTEASERKQKLEELRDVNADAQRNAEDLHRQMEDMQAEAIDRGLLLTLDDAVFTTDDASLSSNGHRRLDALTAFLKQHAERTVAVDGYAGTGSSRDDQALSKRRADTIRAYLVQQGIAPYRLTARGSGEANSATRQEPPRRVEVIIEDSPTSGSRPGVTATR
jgi:outer membrane protein OmpA-like peptidoglycan-associated protein